MKSMIGVICLFAAMIPAAVQAQAVGYPMKPVLVVVPAPAGGGAETETRVWTQKLADNLGQPFVLEFKPGAGTTIGVGFVAKAKPDGYTLGMNTVNLPLAPLRYPDLGWDINSLEPISLLNKRTVALLVSSQLPIHNIKEYIAYARTRPGELNIAASGEGSIDHIMGVWLMNATNTKATFIHYKSSGSAYADLLAGRLQVASVAYTVGGSGYPALVNSGKARNIGTMNLVRSGLAPDVPTLHEQGIANFESPSFLGMLAPGKTPSTIVNRLHGELVKISKLPETQEKLGKGAVITASTPAEYRKFLLAHTELFRKLAQDNNIDMKGGD